MRFTIGWPLIFTGDVSTSVVYVSTSVRPEASRWSSTSHRHHVRSSVYPVARFGRLRKGTGFAGSEMYSSYWSPERGVEPSVAFSPEPRFRGVGVIEHPLAQPAGQFESRRQALVP